MSKVCISSRFDRYNIFFELWLKNCLNYEYDIVIFLDGKVQQIIDRVTGLTTKNRKVSIVDVSKYGNIYTIDNLKFFRTIFELLYFDLNYETIIYTDPDELLLVDNFEPFLKNNKSFLASKGFEVVQHRNESPYDLNKSFISQRKFGIWSDRSYSKSAPYNKVCIFKKGNFPRSIGRHASESSTLPIQIEDTFIFLIHLRELCTKTMLENSKKNITLHQKNHNHHSLNSEKEIAHRLDTWFYPYTIEIPSEIKKIITKHNL